MAKPRAGGSSRRCILGFFGLLRSPQNDIENVLPGAKRREEGYRIIKRGRLRSPSPLCGFGDDSVGPAGTGLRMTRGARRRSPGDDKGACWRRTQDGMGYVNFITNARIRPMNHKYRAKNLTVVAQEQKSASPVL